MSLPLMHEELRERLAARIGREWRTGDRLPTVAQLAKQLHAGQRTTHRALRALADEGLIVSRPRRGTFVARHRVHAAPDSIRGSATGSPAPEAAAPLTMRRTIYLPLGAHREEFVHRIADAFAARSERYGHQVVRDPQANLSERYLQEQPADALALLQYEQANRVRIAPRHALVVINTSGEPPHLLAGQYDLVTVNHHQGGLLAGNAAVAAGYADEQMAYLGRGDAATGVWHTLDQARFNGFNAATSRGVPRANWFFAHTHSEQDADQAVRQYVARLDRPRLIFASCDDLALGFIYCAAAHGMAPGRDYAIVGFDGQGRGRQLREGALATVEIPAPLMGEHAADLLASRLDNPTLLPRTMSLGCRWSPGATLPLASIFTAGSN